LLQSGIPPAEIRESHGYASGTPTIDRDRIFACFGKAGLFAFGLSGKRLWRADIGSNIHGWGSSVSPVLFRDLVIVNASVESESLIAVNRNTGREAWRARGIKESWNTPVLVSLPGGRTELVVAVFGKVLGLDPATGAQLWDCRTDIPWYMAPSLVADRGVVYCVGGRTGGSLAVRAGGKGDVTGTHRVWTGKKGSNVTSPVLANGHLFWMHENLGVAYCANPADGKLLYEERLERAGQVYASPVAADGKLYYLTRDGRTFVLAAQPRFNQLAVNDLRDGSAFNASPAISDGRIYIRSDRFLYCIGSR
jgi:outer membrane protein assembly factor BamB